MTNFLRTAGLFLLSLTLGAVPETALAQRGAHFGGGGFHSGGFGGIHGGNFGGFHGGGFGGFRGGTFRGFRGGLGGFRGGFHNGFGWGGWGYPGWGWGLNIAFGFGPYWGYPYWYGYGPNAYGYPYSYPPYYYGDPYADRNDDGYYGRDYDRGCRCDSDDYRYDHNSSPSKAPRPNAPNTAPGPSAGAAQQGSSNAAYVAKRFADDRLNAAAGSNSRNEFQFAELKQAAVSDDLRPAVRNVIEALRAMPPEAKQRQLESGRYDGLSQQERELVAEAAEVR
jgi:hypothetical protein